MMNDENLGSAGASPKSFRRYPARRVTQRAGRPRSPSFRLQNFLKTFLQPSYKAACLAGDFRSSLRYGAAGARNEKDGM
jgi:hypothetical protein